MGVNVCYLEKVLLKVLSFRFRIPAARAAPARRARGGRGSMGHGYGFTLAGAPQLGPAAGPLVGEEAEQPARAEHLPLREREAEELLEEHRLLRLLREP